MKTYPRSTRRFFDISLCLLTGLVWLVPLTLRAEGPPNIVFIYTDDQAPTAVGIANTQLKTPHIDRIFREGSHLQNAFVTTPVCSPSRATLMTSRYGTELGITDWINPRSEPEAGLDPAMVTWPERLAEAGYDTALIGKWHLGTADRFHPTKNGFNYFMGFRSGGTRPKDPVLELDGETRVFPGFTADVLTDYAIKFINQPRKSPFLLCMHYRAPHAAWLPVREEDWAPYKELDVKIPEPDIPNLNAGKIRQMTRSYYASVASVDRNVGRLLQLLDDKKLSQNTVVIFTSDHGYNLGHHGVWYKGNAQWQLKKLPPQKWPHIGSLQRPNLFDQSLRVPTAVRWPGVIEAGSSVQKVVSNLDWYPTLLAMAGLKPQPDTLLRGRNFLPLLQGKKIAWDDSLYAEYSMKHGAKTHMRAYRTADWKLMIDFKNPGRAELYNLKVDPDERENLIDSEDAAAVKIKQAYTVKIQQLMKKLGDNPK